jgi:ribonuclease HI
VAKVNGWIRGIDKCQETEFEKVKALRDSKLWIEGFRRNRSEEENDQKKRNRAALRKLWP